MIQKTHLLEDQYVSPSYKTKYVMHEL